MVVTVPPWASWRGSSLSFAKRHFLKRTQRIISHSFVLIRPLWIFVSFPGWTDVFRFSTLAGFKTSQHSEHPSPDPLLVSLKTLVSADSILLQTSLWWCSLRCPPTLCSSCFRKKMCDRLNFLASPPPSPQNVSFNAVIGWVVFFLFFFVFKNVKKQLQFSRGYS